MFLKENNTIIMTKEKILNDLKENINERIEQNGYRRVSWISTDEIGEVILQILDKCSDLEYQIQELKSKYESNNNNKTR